jgi:hypothetical protein
VLFSLTMDEKYENSNHLKCCSKLQNYFWRILKVQVQFSCFPCCGCSTPNGTPVEFHRWVTRFSGPLEALLQRHSQVLGKTDANETTCGDQPWPEGKTG